MLVDRGYLSQEQIDDALEYGRTSKLRLGEALLALNLITNDVLSYALAEQFGVRPIELTPEMIDYDLLSRFPLDLLRRYLMLPLVEMGDEITIVVADPNNSAGLEALASMVPKYHFSQQLGDPDQIRRCLDAFALEPASAINRRDPSTTQNIHMDEPGAAPEANAPDYLHWLITMAVQQPDSDVVVRTDGVTTTVSRTPSLTSGIPATAARLHTFAGSFFPTVRDALWRNCEQISECGTEVGVWKSPLRFSTRKFRLQVAIMHDLGGSIIRLRPLTEVNAEEIPGSDGSMAMVSYAPATVVLYDEPNRMELFLLSLCSRQNDTSITLFLQETTRIIFPQVHLYPAFFVDAVGLSSTLGPTHVVFDHPADVNVLSRICYAAPRRPSLLVCIPVHSPVSHKIDGTAAAPAPAIVPGAQEIFKQLNPRVLYLQGAENQIIEMTAGEAIELMRNSH